MNNVFYMIFFLNIVRLRYVQNKLKVMITQFIKTMIFNDIMFIFGKTIDKLNMSWIIDKSWTAFEDDDDL